MSKETLEHLNLNTLIGNTANRGTAWHYRAELQGTESNHYTGPIPVGDVQRRLFNWKAEARRIAVEAPASIATMTHIGDDGYPARWTVVEGRQAICSTMDANSTPMGIFKDGYVIHQYTEWLLGTVARILGDTLTISSAGLLKDGAIAWVEVSVPETLHTPEGLDFRPNLLATTSHDGSIATTFKRTVTATVCDNTRAIALGEKGQVFKVKHSRNSGMKLAEARQALNVVHSLADDFTTEVAHLARITVNHSTWNRFLQAIAPLEDANGEALTGRALTLARNKQEALDAMYQWDERAATWRGTALGVMQAVNTYEHHQSTVRGTSRPERNMLRAITGDYDTVDATTWKSLHKALVTV